MTEFQKTESPKNNKVVTNQNYWDVLRAPLNKRNKEQFIYTYNTIYIKYKIIEIEFLYV